MKEMSKKKRTAIVVASLLAVLGISIGGTYAILQARTNGLKNEFTVGSVETKIYEPEMKMVGKNVSKAPQVENVGINDCYVRARIEISPADAGITVQGIDEANWELKDDGFYYYKQPVAANGGKTTALFTTVVLPDGWVEGEGENAVATDLFQEFDVIVYQEAVQANLAGETNYDTIWKAYYN